MAETVEKKIAQPTELDKKKQQQKPLAERLEGEQPFDWIKFQEKETSK
ncbi:hypothetical protein NT239_09735 [Chitinibacter sp. SCUT-21]